MCLSLLFPHSFLPFLLLSLSPVPPQMRRTASFPASPALLPARIPGALKVDRTGSGGRGSGEVTAGGAEAAAGAGVGASSSGEARAKTRPDSSRRPTGHSLTPETNVFGREAGVT